MSFKKCFLKTRGTRARQGEARMAEFSEKAAMDGEIPPLAVAIN